MHAVTYSVMFIEETCCSGILHHPGIEYYFTTLSGGEPVDDAYFDIHQRFGFIDTDGFFVRKLSIENPVIKEVKGVQI